MNRQEFIDRLRMALNGRVAADFVQENVNYYEDYINTQIRMGRSESEVLDTLGDPRLIAKTIVETSGQSGAGNYESSDYHNTGYHNNRNYDSEYENGKKAFIWKNKTVHNIPGWLWGIIIILIIALIFWLVFSVMSFLVPIILPIFVVLFLVKLFRDWLN